MTDVLSCRNRNIKWILHHAATWEIFEALELGLNLAKEKGADLMLATDPDADRVDIAMKCGWILPGW